MINIKSFYCMLRVPLIFIIDELFKSSFGFPNSSDEINEYAQYYKVFFKIIVSSLSKFNKLTKKNNDITLIAYSI